MPKLTFFVTKNFNTYLDLLPQVLYSVAIYIVLFYISSLSFTIIEMSERLTFETHNRGKRKKE